MLLRSGARVNRRDSRTIFPPHMPADRITHRIGVDLGGTKIEAACLDGDGVIVARERVATPRDYDGTITAIAGLVERLEDELSVRGSVGVGIPGAADPSTGLVKNANSSWLIGRPLARDLGARLGREMRLMNDANCFAISEAADGAAAGASVVFGVILGTGVGGGIVVRGRALEGSNLIAGEWGHNALPRMSADEYPGPPCYCGRRGCVETFLSGPAFEAEFARLARPLSSRDIVRAAEAGDADANAALARYHDRLARGLSMVINLLDPDVIVLGGGMSNLPRLAESVAALLPLYVFSNTVRTRVVRHRHGDSSGVRGAAWLWPAAGAL
jgi:fructokinase